MNKTGKTYISFRKNEYQGKADVSRDFVRHEAIDPTAPLVPWIHHDRLFRAACGSGTRRQRLPWAAHGWYACPEAAPRVDPRHFVPTRHFRSCVNRIFSSVSTATFGPSYGYLLTASSKGQFTWWDGSTFKFELVFAGHDDPITAARWNRRQLPHRLLSVDRRGAVKMFADRALREVAAKAPPGNIPIFDVVWSPAAGNKCVTAGEQIVVWDLEDLTPECVLTDYGRDARTVAWHPTLSAVAVAGGNTSVLLIDPRAGKLVRRTTKGHLQGVNVVRWAEGSRYTLISGARDSAIHWFDLRRFGEPVQSVTGAPAGVTALAEHPRLPGLLSVGCYDGSLGHLYRRHPIEMRPGLDPEQRAPQHPTAHRRAVTSLEWHPTGNLLVSSSADGSACVWARPHKSGAAS